MADQIWLYALLCRDHTLYVGISQDVEKRFRQHASGKGSFYTRLNRPRAILAAQPFPTRAEARSAEIALKAMDYTRKLEWVEQWPWTDPTG